ncbi:MAG: hypothetical protein RSB41_01050 [Bacilli bacterium]
MKIKKKIKLTKIGKITVAILLLLIILLLTFITIFNIRKETIHLISENKDYTLKIEYPIIHNKELDNKKNYFCLN